MREFPVAAKLDCSTGPIIKGNGNKAGILEVRPDDCVELDDVREVVSENHVSEDVDERLNVVGDAIRFPRPSLAQSRLELPCALHNSVKSSPSRVIVIALDHIPHVVA